METYSVAKPALCDGSGTIECEFHREGGTLFGSLSRYKDCGCKRCKGCEKCKPVQPLPASDGAKAAATEYWLNWCSSSLPDGRFPPEQNTFNALIAAFQSHTDKVTEGLRADNAALFQKQAEELTAVFTELNSTLLAERDALKAKLQVAREALEKIAIMRTSIDKIELIQRLWLCGEIAQEALAATEGGKP